MFKKAIVPIDFSVINKKVIEWIPYLKKIGLEEVVLVHIIDEELIKHIEKKTDTTRLQEIMRSSAIKELEEFKVLLEKNGLKTSIYHPIPTGKIWEEVIQAINKTKADLVIVSSKGTNWFKEALMGSTSEAIIKNSPVPVLIAKVLAKKEDGKTTYKIPLDNIFSKILVATDLSEGSTILYECAKKIAKKARSEVFLVHVIEYYRAPTSLKRLVQEELEDIVKEFEQYTPKVYYQIRTGVPHKEIIDAAIEQKVTSILIGEKGDESFLEELLMGSTADAVIRHSPVPVLVCKTRKK